MGIKNVFNRFVFGDNEENGEFENYEVENCYYEVGEGDGFDFDTRANSGVSVSSGSSIEMIVVKPEKLETVTQIADYLVDRKTILLNLEETNKDTARRLIDFLNGVAYAINGDLRKVATNTYVVTPSNVELSGEKLSSSQDAAYTKE